ncbi:MAG: Holliday junction resolvase RuvX [bacterium]
MMRSENRILALDYGTKRIGVAMSDALGIVAQPIETISYENSDVLWTKLDKIRNAFSIERIVVGMPLNMDGSEGSSAEAARSFGSRLNKRYSVPVDFWDERLSSQVAEKTIRSIGKEPSRRKEQVDKIAAVWILQGYLDRLNRQNPAP